MTPDSLGDEFGTKYRYYQRKPNEVTGPGAGCGG